MSFPSYTKAQNYKGGFEKFVYNKLKELSEGGFTPDTYDISVSVSDGTNPLGSVVVTLTGSKKSFSGKTGAKGGCNLNDVLAGDYTVSAVKEGYIYEESTFTVTGNDSIDIVMTAEEDDDVEDTA